MNPRGASRVSMILTLLQYKAWADEVTYGSLFALPKEEVTRPRKTNFGTMAQTLNHVFVVDDIFRHHLLGEPHGYSARNTPDTPPLDDLFQKQREMNRWLFHQAEGYSGEELRGEIHFEFVGGGAGVLTRSEIFLHLVNHATYHRGFVNDMMYQVPARPPANDLSVFLRDAHR